MYRGVMDQCKTKLAHQHTTSVCYSECKLMQSERYYMLVLVCYSKCKLI
jgi:hypothetical protein